MILLCRIFLGRAVFEACKLLLSLSNLAKAPNRLAVMIDQKWFMQ